MKTILFSILVSLLINTGFAQPIPTKSLYLGQTPPGTTPIKFNIPYSSGNKASECIAISPDGKEIFYGETTMQNTHYWIKHFTYSNGAWGDTTVLFDGYTGSVLSPSGDTLFFHKYSNGFSSTNYFSVKNDTGWSTPSVCGSGVGIGTIHLANSGNYYVNGPKSKGVSKMVITNSDTTFYSLGIANTNFTISRDESFIIFQSPDGEYGHHDLFISFRKNDDTWTTPKNIGSPINSNDWDVEPYVTSDNKYLFFMRANPTQTIYWVQIDKLIGSLKKNVLITATKVKMIRQSLDYTPLLYYIQ